MSISTISHRICNQLSSDDDHSVATMNTSNCSSPSPSYPAMTSVGTVSPVNTFELEAARHRLKAATKWETNASTMLEISQRDVNNARSELSDAAAYLKSMEQKLGIVSRQQNDLCAASVVSKTTSEASVVSKMSSDAQWTPALTVTGSPIDELNGTYTQCGYFDYVPKYVKVTECNGKQEVIMIYRCKVSETAKRWYISIGTPDNGVYFVGAKEGLRRPPIKGWVNIATRASERLRVKSNF